jgi:predicted nucleic acid-binding protein
LSSILVDTSFLITLADPARRHHETAKTYLRESLKANVPLYLSAIVASEFQVKQAVNDLPLRNFIILPFNIDHAMTAGLLMRSINRDPGDERNSVKDDVKLIAQAVCESITHVLTEDEKTLAKSSSGSQMLVNAPFAPSCWSMGSKQRGSMAGKLPSLASEGFAVESTLRAPAA